MKNFMNTVVENKRAMIFIALFLSLIGFYLIFQIPQGVFPDATFPRITVLVDYGLAPLQQMEIEVVKPIEEAVKMVPGVRIVRSATNRGSSEINIDFNWDEDMFQAYQLVQAQVSGIQNALPDGVEIFVRRINTSTFPVAGYALNAPGNDLVKLRDFAVYTLRPQLADIPGIFNIEIIGGDEREYRVNIDPERLAARKLDFREVADAVQQSNSVEFLGRLQEHNKMYLNISDNRYQSMAQIGETVIRTDGATPLRLRDVADIEPTVKETFLATASDQKPSVLVNIVIQPGSNAVTIMAEVERRMAEIRATMPPNISLKKWYDLSEFIRAAIGSVRDSILLGTVLTVLILLLFLRRWRITLVTILIIPAALMITFVFIRLLGMDLNLMSLGGLAAAIGILVDNAIVVIENIDRYLESGESRLRAVVHGTTEIIRPLIGATLTTLVVFIPLVFLGGLPGIFFKPLASTLAITIGVSMLLAVFLTPALAVVLISTRKKAPGKVLPRLISLHRGILDRALNRPVYVYLLSLMLAAAAVLFFLWLPSGFLPEWDEGTIVLDFQTPAGSSVEGTHAMLSGIERHLEEIPEIEIYSLRIGTSLGHPRMAPTEGDFLISLKHDRDRSSFEIMDELREFAKANEPRLEAELFQVLPDRLNSDLAGEIAPVAIQLFGNNLELMQQTAAQIADSLENIPGLVDVYRGFQSGEPEISIRIRSEAAARLGLRIADVNRAVTMALWGEVPTGVMDGLKIIPVRLRYRKQVVDQMQKIRHLPVYLSGIDRMVRLDELAELQPAPGLTDVEHENLSLVVNVTAQLSGRDLGGAVGDVRKMLTHIHLPQGISAKIGGQYESQQQAFSELMLILVFGAMLVFTVLLFEFKSFRAALVIIGGTVLAVSGVFLILWLTGIPLDISAFMGMIMIVGVVVNNGILVVDFAELYRKDHPDLREAVLTAGEVRLRPILMTTLSTIMGFIPLALALGEGAEMLQPLAVSMIGGMSVSILISLLIIPVFYYRFAR
jgi:CzcA family heavy metal efflux pump